MTNTTWPLLSFNNTFETKVQNFKRWTVPNGLYYKKLHLMKEAGLILYFLRKSDKTLSPNFEF